MRKVAGKAGAAAAAKVSTLLTRITSALPSMRRSERDAAEFAQDVVLAFSASGRTLALHADVHEDTDVYTPMTASLKCALAPF
jgi:hypothetical protein